MNFAVLSEADAELFDAATWYENRETGLGEKFFREWARIQDLIRRNPGSPPILEYYSGAREIRRCLFRRFPYSAIYIHLPDKILVIAIAHGKRRPYYWKDRLPQD